MELDTLIEKNEKSGNSSPALKGGASLPPNHSDNINMKNNQQNNNQGSKGHGIFL